MGKNITIAILVVALLSLGVYAYGMNTDQTNHLAYIEKGSENNFLSLDSALKDMSDDLEVITVSNDDTFICTKLAEVTKTASHAQKAITTLPINHNTALNATDFLSLCEDYSYTLMLSLINGGNLSENDKESLKQLSDNCAILAEGSSTFRESRTDDFAWYDDDYEFITDEENDSFVKMFSDFEDSYGDFEGIEYNGKYSANTKKQEVSASENKDIYDYKLIESQLNEQYKDNENVKVSYLNKDTVTKGATSDYHTFNISSGADHMQLDYDLASGNLIKARSSKVYDESILTEDEVRTKADEYLSSMGLDSLNNISMNIEDNVATLNYAYAKDDIIYYPNSLSVRVSMQDGELVGFDASEYYKYSTDRTAHTTQLTAQQAQENISKDLTVNSSRLTVIPMNDKTESYAYEFDVSKGGDNYKILIDADSGEELMITKSENKDKK